MARPAKLGCPMCRREIKKHSGTQYLDYENKYTKLELQPGDTEKERAEKQKRKKRNERRHKLRQAAKERKEQASSSR